MVVEMIKMINSISEVWNSEAYWLEVDGYLASVVSENFDDFCSKVEFDGTSYNALPDCRRHARKKYLHIESLHNIVDWCLGEQDFSELGSEAVGLFFCEEMEHMFYKFFANQFRDYVKKEKMDYDRATLVLKERLFELDGATAKHMVTQKWGK